MNKITRIIVSIDLENINTPLKKGLYSKNLFTIEVLKPLLKILDYYKIKAVFFASIFEYCRFGISPIAKVLTYLQERGHDIQLHTHPYWCFGKEHMWQYPVEAQTRIIREGIDIFESILGYRPIGHRYPFTGFAGCRATTRNYWE